MYKLSSTTNAVNYSFFFITGNPFSAYCLCRFIHYAGLMSIQKGKKYSHAIQSSEIVHRLITEGESDLVPRRRKE